MTAIYMITSPYRKEIVQLFENWYLLLIDMKKFISIAYFYIPTITFPYFQFHL